MAWIAFVLVAAVGVFLTFSFTRLVEKRREEMKQMEEADEELINKALEE